MASLVSITILPFSLTPVSKSQDPLSQVSMGFEATVAVEDYVALNPKPQNPKPQNPKPLNP